jgi:hypothetical protein
MLTPMKSLLTIFFLSLYIILNAQVPQGMNYQAVARNSQGNILQNQPVGLRFTIRDNSLNGSIVYQETQAAVTDQFGVFAVVIGNGSAVQGTFSSVSWGNGAKFLQVELDAAGGVNYTDMGTTQLMSVPYALYAETSANGPVGPQGPSGPPSFDPEHSDGLDSVTGVHLSLTGTSTYTVPVGKNLHAFMRHNIFIPLTLINNDTIYDSQIWAILPPGTVIGNGATALFLSGYVAPVQYPAIYQSITGNPYTVPAGKTLYLSSVMNVWDPSQVNFYIDSVPVLASAALANVSRSSCLVISSGSVISTDAPVWNKVFINGILK